MIKGIVKFIIFGKINFLKLKKFLDVNSSVPTMTVTFKLLSTQYAEIVPPHIANKPITIAITLSRFVIVSSLMAFPDKREILFIPPPKSSGNSGPV